MKIYPLELKPTPDSLKYYFIQFICIHGDTQTKKTKFTDKIDIVRI